MRLDELEWVGTGTRRAHLDVGSTRWIFYSGSHQQYCVWKDRIDRRGRQWPSVPDEPVYSHIDPMTAQCVLYEICKSGGLHDEGSEGEPAS